MVKRLFIISTVIILCNLFWIPNLHSEVIKSIKSGEIYLKESSGFDEDVFKVNIGDKIKADCKFYIDDFLEKKIISANATIKNTASKNMYFTYNVAFFDKDMNLVGCASQGLIVKGFEPGKETLLGSCIIPLPSSEFSKVKYYQVVLYESEDEIGKK